MCNTVYEVNYWLFGLCKPLLGGPSVQQTAERKEGSQAARQEQSLCMAENILCSKADRA